MERVQNDEVVFPLFEGMGLKKGDIISLPTVEYDGAPISGYDEDGFPIVDKGALNFEKSELLGFERDFRVTETTATFMVFQKNQNSGIIINTCETGGSRHTEIYYFANNLGYVTVDLMIYGSILTPYGRVSYVVHSIQCRSPGIIPLPFLQRMFIDDWPFSN